MDDNKVPIYQDEGNHQQNAKKKKETRKLYTKRLQNDVTQRVWT